MYYYTQIHEICFWGQGGYEWSTVYNFPIWLRKFTWNKLNEHYTKQKEAQEGAVITEENVGAKVDKPPTYTAKRATSR